MAPVADHRAAIQILLDELRRVGSVAIEAVGFKLGRWVDSVLMQRALGEGASTLP